MLPEPLPEFASFRASSNVGDYSEIYGPRYLTGRWIRQRISSPSARNIPLPPGVVKAHDAFLALEGRASRRIIDIPDPAYDKGLAELNVLIDRVVAARHEGTLLALLASLEVDLD